MKNARKKYSNLSKKYQDLTEDKEACEKKIQELNRQLTDSVQVGVNFDQNLKQKEKWIKELQEENQQS